MHMERNVMAAQDDEHRPECKRKGVSLVSDCMPERMSTGIGAQYRKGGRKLGSSNYARGSGDDTLNVNGEVPKVRGGGSECGRDAPRVEHGAPGVEHDAPRVEDDAPSVEDDTRSAGDDAP
jgi:hypothetical protein